MSLNIFNIRVYGILINELNQVLVTDEFIQKRVITKLPGGGLEYGEGTIDCLKREFIEETNNRIEVTEHFYTTDFFQPSAFHNNHQIISIYYLVKPISNFEIATTEKIMIDENQKKYAQTFRWIDLKNISENDFTLPIDKVVGRMMKEKI